MASEVGPGIGDIGSAAKSRGSRGFRPESWVPTPDDSFQFVIEDLGPCLEQEMAPSLRSDLDRNRRNSDRFHAVSLIDITGIST